MRNPKTTIRSSLLGVATGLGRGTMKTHGKQLNAMTTPDPNQELAIERGVHPVPAAWPWLRGGNGDKVPAKRASCLPWARAEAPPGGPRARSQGVPMPGKSEKRSIIRPFRGGSVLDWVRGTTGVGLWKAILDKSA